MLGAAVIVFRESFEAALLIGIIAAATRTIPGRGRFVSGGIILGAIGALAIAALTGHIAELFGGMGQELFNATVLGLAVLMLASHNIWMSVHGAELASDARRVGREVSEGRRALSAILVVIAVAVLREGSETALFLYGLLSAGTVSHSDIFAGSALGLVAGVAVGAVMYAGILRVPMRWFFAVTSALILLLAAAMAAQMARFLVQADVLPSLADPVWNTSNALPADSPVGALLHALMGYDPQPSGMQLVFYLVTAVTIWLGMQLARRQLPRARSRAAA
ncbi:MAG: FTR1 family protein [Pseudomonadota bacterium]|nr:FTR1 family protein [Pseudomonadota bacterium]